MKLLIAVPCMDKMDTAFVRCLLGLQKTGETAIQLLANSLVYMSREHLASFAVEQGAEWLLFLDSDMIFGEDLLVKLMQAAEEEKADVVTALAFRRRAPYTPTVWKNIEITEGDQPNIVEEFDELPEGRFEVAACGMAGALIRTDTLLRCFQEYRMCFIPFPEFGEDISFCIRARQLGAKIICDRSVQMGHISQTIVDEGTYRNYKEKRDARKS